MNSDFEDFYERAFSELCDELGDLPTQGQIQDRMREYWEDCECYDTD